LNYWQKTYAANNASAPACDEHLHDNITLEQQKRAPSMSRLSESDRKQNETNKVTLKKQRNNRKTERKSEKITNIHMEKQKDSEAPSDWQAEAGLQQSKPTVKPGQTTGTKQRDNCDSGKHKKISTLHKVSTKRCFEGACAWTQVFSTIQHIQSCLSMQQAVAQ